MGDAVDAAVDHAADHESAAGHEAILPGTVIPPFVAPPVTRLQLALFAAAGADPNSIHLDDAVAQASGLPRAIVHGMLTMAFLGRLLTRQFPLASVRSLEGRFVAMAFPGDTITCTGTVRGCSMKSGEHVVDLDLAARNQDDVTLLTGKACVAWS